MADEKLFAVKTPRTTVGNGQQAAIYTGDRTEGTKNVETRVRRLFSFAQIFFFALSYMSSWEAVHLSLPCYTCCSFPVSC